MNRLQGKAAVITGAAGGIGAAAVRLFASEGANVLATDIDETALREIAAASPDSRVETVAADVSVESDVARAVETAVSRLGGIDILLHAAGIASFTRTEECSLEEWDRVHAVNTRGAFLFARAVIPHMRSRGGGSIVFVSSINGVIGAPGLAAYSASKGAVLALARTLAIELAPDLIRVNSLCPASVDTSMLQLAFKRAPDPAAAREANIKRHPLGRLATPDEIAAFALFLASDEAGFVTGGTHFIDGGAHLARR